MAETGLFYELSPESVEGKEDGSLNRPFRALLFTSSQRESE